MTGWCPYKTGTLEEQECHFDGYCSECPHNKSDLISRQEALETIAKVKNNMNIGDITHYTLYLIEAIDNLPSAQSDSDLITEDEYAEMKQTFLRMASYIDSLLICSDEQKETLMNFISQLAEYMPWRQED